MSQDEEKLIRDEEEEPIAEEPAEAPIAEEADTESIAEDVTGDVTDGAPGALTDDVTEEKAEEVTEDVTVDVTEVVTDEALEAVTPEDVLAERGITGTKTETVNDTAVVPVSKGDRNRNMAIVIIIVVIVLAVIVLLKVNDVIGSGVVNGDGGSAQGEIAEGVVAKVGGAEITQDMVDRAAALVLYSDYGRSIDTLAPEDVTIFKNEILIYMLVQSELVKEHLKAEGVGSLTEERKAFVAENVDAYYASIENPEETLGAMGVSRADVEYFLELNEYMALYREEVLKTNPVTDEEVQQFYEENGVYFEVPYQISASHILIMDAEHTPEKRAELEAILERARGGEDFAALAGEYSEDTGSAANGGDVGFFGESNNFVPEFSAAALALENVGDISDIVETEYGYHIIKLTDKQEATTQALSEVRDLIVPYLEDMRTGEATVALKEEITVTYFVEVDPATGEPPISLTPQAAPAEGTLPETVPLPEE